MVHTPKSWWHLRNGGQAPWAQRSSTPEDSRSGRSLRVVERMFFSLPGRYRTGRQPEVLRRAQPLLSESQVWAESSTSCAARGQLSEPLRASSSSVKCDETSTLGVLRGLTGRASAQHPASGRHLMKVSLRAPTRALQYYGQPSRPPSPTPPPGLH